MKAFVVLLSAATMALASLEPASYRPPGSSSSQYLPPYVQQQPQHRDHHQESGNPSAATSSQYLPPSYNAPAVPTINPSSQYLPPQSRQQQQRPSNNYLPAADKPIPSLAPPSALANDYLPPNQSSNQEQLSNQYLPPQSTRSQLSNDYLPPSRTTAAAPTNNYLPPLTPSTQSLPAKPEYLPPVQIQTQSAVPPKNDYLPPSNSRLNSRPTAGTQQRIVTTPSISVSPYELDAPAYSKPQPNFSELSTTATSSALRSRYSQTAHSSAVPTVKSYEQPPGNYLPPLTSESAQSYESSAQDGYQYGSAGRSAEPTEPAKYDFEYRVSDEFGNDFGHKESRAGAQTSGVYTVLLPDGRKQIVHYEADEHGFKPRISYEEVASVLGSKTPALAEASFAGYDKNANSLDAY